MIINYKNFALIIAAHNEEMVIAQSIESLKSLDYPKELYDIYVIADNCKDKTPQIAKEHGAIVCERHDLSKIGKGYALDWMFNKIFKMDKKYDGVVIFDADNLASKNFLKEMNKRLLQGYKVVQGYIDSKNPHDSWITESYSISFWSVNRLFQIGRQNLHLSNQLSGTGFCVTTDLLKKIGWKATCLAEDLEFTCQLVLKGYKVGYAYDAVVYDEKPLTLMQSWRQRKRWMQGFADVVSRYFWKLMKNAVKKHSFTSFDCGMYSFQSFVVLLSVVSVIITFVQSIMNKGIHMYIASYMYAPLLLQFSNFFSFLFTPFITVLEKKLSKKLFAVFAVYSLNIFLFNALFDPSTPMLYSFGGYAAYFVLFSIAIYLIGGKKSFNIFIWYLLYQVFTITWIPITIQGIINKNNKDWNHTKHTRQISIKDIEDVDGRSAA